MASIIYTVEDGDCLVKIAEAHGFFSDTLWNLPENKDLKDKRKSQYLLVAGDQVTIPDLRPKKVECDTDKEHKFRLKGVPVQLMLQLKRGGKVRANMKYRLAVGSQVIEGTTDADGKLQQWLSPQVTTATLTLEDGETYRVNVGYLDPIETERGLRHRLVNLGFLSSITASPTAFRKAIAAFQESAGMEITGVADDATKAKIRESHKT